MAGWRADGTGARSSGLFDPDEREPLGIQFSQLSFHEAYHAGQLGVLRRALGKAGGIA